MAQANELLDELVGNLFQVGRAVGRTGEGLGIDKAALFVLMMLSESGPARPSACAQALALDQSTVSRHLRSLELAGHVERRPDPLDGRAQLFRVTTSGRSILSRLRIARRKRLDEALADWSTPDRRSLSQLLARLAADLQAKQEPIQAPIQESSQEPSPESSAIAQESA